MGVCTYVRMCVCAYMFGNRKYGELSYPPKSENVRPHSSNSIENATPL